MWIFTQTQENGLKRTDFGGAEAMAQNVKSASLQAWHAEHAEQDLQSWLASGIPACLWEMWPEALEPANLEAYSTGEEPRGTLPQIRWKEKIPRVLRTLRMVREYTALSCFFFFFMLLLIFLPV